LTGFELRFIANPVLLCLEVLSSGAED